MSKITKLQNKLDKAKVTYFKAHEFFVKGGSHSSPRSRGYGKNTDPPEGLLNNIVPTAVVLQTAREMLGAPIIISSCYRSPAYNKAIGGASRSLHQTFQAADNVATDLVKLYHILATLRAAGAFLGGLGGYSSFVHIDTRGYNATWGIRY
jgi:hypothetical protein